MEIKWKDKERGEFYCPNCNHIISPYDKSVEIELIGTCSRFEEIIITCPKCKFTISLPEIQEQ